MRYRIIPRWYSPVTCVYVGLNYSGGAYVITVKKFLTHVACVTKQLLILVHWVFRDKFRGPGDKPRVGPDADDEDDNDADDMFRSSADHWRRFTAYCIHRSTPVSRPWRLRYATYTTCFLSVVHAYVYALDKSYDFHIDLGRRIFFTRTVARSKDPLRC